MEYITSQPDDTEFTQDIYIKHELKPQILSIITKNKKLTKIIDKFVHYDSM